MIWNNLDERQEIILKKYTKHGETAKEFIDRISLDKHHLKEIFERGEALWGGRNLYAIGRKGNITGSNCYVTKDPEDNLEAVYQADYEIAKTYSYGGGQGLNLSKLRPKGAKVNNTSNTSPGPMVFAEKYSHTTMNTQQHNRRGALMLAMNIDHPDIIDFATAKLDLEKINGANISIAITKDFMEAVALDRDWTMEFETPYEIIKKTVKAKKLLELIAYTNHTMGDPGMLFIDEVNIHHFLSEYDEVKFTATNPCGEQPLMAYGSCNLGSINLFAFVREPFTDNAYFDFERFKFVVNNMTSGLDMLLDLLGERHPLPEQREHVQQWREIGLGVMGLADLALGLKMSYGSARFNAKLSQIMRTMLNESVKSSALRAKERGVFPKFDLDKIERSSFFRTNLDSEVKLLVKNFGLRNSRLLSIAPTGSISNVLGVSGGVEPFFMLGYNRTIQSMFEGDKTITVWEKTPKALAQHLGVETIEELPTWAKVTSQNIVIEDRLKVQSIIQRYVDTAISSTFNVPNSATVDDIADLYYSCHAAKLKGATVFRDNCVKVGILSGVAGWQSDENVADPVKIEVQEDWFNKETGEGQKFTTIVVAGQTFSKTNVSAYEHELCPVCGAPLVKKGGCTGCSNQECGYEKCAI